jgi:MEMO1 family protein
MPREHTGGRRHAAGVHLLHFVCVREDFAELAREHLYLVCVKLEVGERRNRNHFCGGELGGHGRFYNVRYMDRIRRAAVAGSWYPGSSPALAAAVDRHLAPVDRDLDGDLVAIVSPHAGLMYSGPVAAHAYHLLRHRRFDVAVLVGPSHFVGFEGVAVVPSGGFETPFGVARIDAACAADVMAASSIVREHASAHVREHSLEMQLPFLQHVAPDATIVPLVMGHQTPDTAHALGETLAAALRGRPALLVASTDLSHYESAATAARLDAVVLDCVSRFDAEGLQAALNVRPEHACGGGPLVAVMRAAKRLGARDAVVLDYADSGDVSGDKSAVVGYMAAAFGTFENAAPTKSSTTEVTDTNRGHG